MGFHIKRKGRKDRKKSRKVESERADKKYRIHKKVQYIREIKYTTHTINLGCYIQSRDERRREKSGKV